MKPRKIKIEVFKITLNNDTDRVKNPNFRDLFKKQLLTSDESLTDDELFTKFNESFTKTIDNSGKYYQSSKKAEKAFSVFDVALANVKENYIHGVLKGGFKGDNKTSSNLDDRDKTEKLDDKVINNRHFFLLHAPLGSNVGFLFFQSFSQENIRVDFITFLKRKIFKFERQYNQPDIQPFIAKSIREEFLDGAVVSKITYSQKVLGSVFGEETFKTGPSHYNIKVTIEPTGERKKISVNQLEKKFASLLDEKKFLGKALGRFSKKRGVLVNNKKETPFTIGGTDDILPIIYLNEDYIDANNQPKIKEIRLYCEDLLTKIVNEENERTKVKPV